MIHSLNTILAVATSALLLATGCTAPWATETAGVRADGDAPMVRGGVVARVVDGDTAHIVIDGVREKVRFIGVDTPESTRETEPYGREASAYTKSLLDGRYVWIETDAELRDRYGRLLAYVWLERPDSVDSGEVRAKQLNARLVLEGYAQVYTFPPNVRYTEVYVACQREAREANRGLWAIPGAADPLTGRRSESVP